ncbi:MAG: hypothetical protein IJQ23_02135 [Clostridia bacterium]|nr:hypothetical protein [Clostridia bacterium]MBR0189169.1 hypothetical protein [Clostridia bacterium]
MSSTKEEKKAKCTEIMETLGIYKPYITGFNKKDKVCFFERFAGFWVYQEPEIETKMKEIEKKYNCMVYAITHELTEFGELYSFLVLTDHKAEWKNIVEKTDKANEFYAFAYVWNKDDDTCSEFGTVMIKSFGGGIMRFA